MEWIASLLFFVAVISNCVGEEECEDKTWQCLIWKDECSKSENKEFMTTKCRKTCGLCTVKGCKDESPRCQRFLPYCKNKQSKEYLQKICQKSCGYCEDKATPFHHEDSRPKPQLPGNCGRPDLLSGRVINGVNAKKGAWPWQVLITYFDYPLCGGSIISPNWIVTAAHCVAGNEVLIDYFKIIAGGHDLGDKVKGTTYNVSKIITHEGYVPSTFDNDIALIKVAEPILFGRYIKPICLPEKDEDVSLNAECFITGWGKIDVSSGFHRYLQQAHLPVIDNKQCELINTKSTGLKITDGMLCAGHSSGAPTSGCHGDSGGPFVCQTGQNKRWVLQGAVSWGSESCNAKEAYTVFARISHLRKWIDDHLD